MPTNLSIVAIAGAPAVPPVQFVTSVHSSGRYLLDQVGQPILVNSDSAWGLIGSYPGAATTPQNATNQAHYFSDRATNGFNATLIDIGGGPDASGNQPFTTFPTLNSSYWAGVDAMIALAASHGMSLYLGVADAYFLIGQSWTAAQMTTYGQALATRWANTATFPGIIWYFGNDYGGSGVGSGNATNMDAKYEGFITGLTNAGDTRPRTIELGYYESLSTDSATWATRVNSNNIYTYNVTYEACLRAYAFSPAMPAMFAEGAYENATTGHPDTALDLRKLICWPLTCGSCGSFYGNDSLWPFATGWQSQLDTAIVTQRKTINSVFAGIAWWKLVPDTGHLLVTSGRGTQYTTNPGGANTNQTNDTTYGHYVTSAYSADGKLAVIYNPDTSINTAMTISSSVLGTSPSITAIDPTNGATSSLGWTTTPTKGANAGGDHDWLFLITAG